jgi:hypothetical protein
MFSIENALISLVLLSISIGFTVFMMRKQASTIEQTLFSVVQEGLKSNAESIQSWISDNQSKISRAHSIIGSQGADKKRIMQGERLLNAEIYKQSPILDAVKSFVSPTFSDWMDNNPDIVMELAPRIQQIMSNMPQNAEYSESSESRPHPFGLNSEE